MSNEHQPPARDHQPANDQQTPPTGTPAESTSGNESTVQIVETKLDFRAFAELELQKSALQLQERLQERQQEDAKSLKRWVFTLAVLIGGGSALGLYQTVKYAEGQVREALDTTIASAVDEGQAEVRIKIAEQFQTERIRTIVGDVAATEAQDLLHRQVQPDVERLKGEIRGRLNTMEAEVQDRFGAFNKKNQELETAMQQTVELSRLKATEIGENLRNLEARMESRLAQLDERERIYRLTDRALAGSRSDYEELDRLANSSGREASGDIALAQIFTIKNFYVSSVRVPESDEDLRRADKEIKASELNTCDLLMGLRSNDWRVRVKVVRQLGNRKEKGVPLAVLETIEKDSHLSVVRDAVVSWRKLTGSQIDDVFGLPGARKWWTENGVVFEQGLPDRSCK